MSTQYPIQDLFVKTLAASQADGLTRWLALSDQDHLLRRFGLAEVVRVPAGADTGLRLREVADEVWALIEGQVEFVWRDVRSASPTHDHRHRLTCSQPTLVLVPFGVAFGVRSLNSAALLLRLATHVDGAHQGDRSMPWEAAG